MRYNKHLMNNHLMKAVSIPLACDAETLPDPDPYTPSEVVEGTDPSIIEDVPELCSIKLRVATMDGILEDILNNECSECTTEKEVHEVIDPIVENAIARYHLPTSYRKRVNKLIVRALKKKDGLTVLINNIARYSADELVDVVTTQDDDMDGETIKNPKTSSQPDDGDTEVSSDGKVTDLDTVEIVESTQEKVTVNDIVDDIQLKNSLSLTATSILVSRVAASKSRAYAYSNLKYMCTKLRHVLPKSFLTRYRLG